MCGVRSDNSRETPEVNAPECCYRVDVRVDAMPLRLEM
jgi:hypothetical protein